MEVVPYALCENNVTIAFTQIKKLDFAEHSKGLENVRLVYPNLQVLGVAVTDLAPTKDLAILHTMYANKESEFKAQGILTHPLIVSIGTRVNEANSFSIDAYCFNQPYLFCKEFMGITSFEKLEATLSFGDADIESMAPLFEAMNDQEQFVAGDSVEQLIEKLVQNLKSLKVKCESKESEALRVEIRRLIDRLGEEHDYNVEELAYLLDYAALQRAIGNKINRVDSEIRS